MLFPDAVEAEPEDLFLICSENYADEIREDLECRGIPDTQTAIVDDMDACVRFIMRQMKE